MNAIDSPPVRVFVVDDHEAVREGLRRLVDAAPDLRVVGDAGTCIDALARIPATRPDLVLLDLHLPDASGEEACRRIREGANGAKVLVLTADDDPATARACRSAGAVGLVVKASRRGEILIAVRRAARGDDLFPEARPAAADEACATVEPLHGPTDEQRRVDELSELQRTILVDLSHGRTNQVIAQHLGVSEKAVKKQVTAIFAALGVPGRVGAAVIASRTLGVRIDQPVRT